MTKGFDVSNWQGAPSLAKFQAARGSGYEFVAIKASEGTYRDPTFTGNWQYARQAGFAVRIAYHFARPGTGAAQEAATLVAAVNAAGGLQAGDNIAIDAEAGSGEVGGYIHALLHAASDALGLATPFVYSGNWFIPGHLDDPDLADHHLWDAVYNSGSTFPAPVAPWQGHQVVIWQHADNENVPGFGAVDGDLFNGSIQELAALGKGGAVEDEDAMTLDHARLHVCEWYMRIRPTPPAQSEVDGWASQLAGGANVEAVLAAFRATPEAQRALSR
jgi:hypothetical protein